jgi:hypothetical protein
VTVAYLLSSALIVGTGHPWRWVLGIGLVLLGGLMISDGLHVHAIGRAIDSIFRGYAGLRVALWGADDTGSGGAGRWAVATVLWLAIGALLIVYASRRHPQR